MYRLDSRVAGPGGGGGASEVLPLHKGVREGGGEGKF